MFLVTVLCCLAARSEVLPQEILGFASLEIDHDTVLSHIVPKFTGLISL